LTVDRNNINIRNSHAAKPDITNAMDMISHKTCGLVNLKPRRTEPKEAEAVEDVQDGGLGAVGGGCEREVPRVEGGVCDLVGEEGGTGGEEGVYGLVHIVK
jgi:hypothetical protein